MFKRTLEEIARAGGGRILQGRGSTPIRGVFTDTRTPIAGGLFIAIEGPRFDGHRFLETALKSGAAAVMVSRKDTLLANGAFRDRGVVWVPHTREGFQGLAAEHRERLSSTRWFGVTGSAGKSTVKDMLASILSAGAGWTIHRAAKSFNNDIGVPATILDAGPEHRAVVLEQGTNHPGEIQHLAAIARPHIAVLTNAGPSHLEAFGSIAGVAEEKSHILDFQGSADTAVLNADDPHCEYWRGRSMGQVVTFGLGKEAEVRGEALDERPGKGAHFFLCRGTQATEIQLRVPGRHNVLNALAAAAAARAAGVEMENIAQGLAAFSGVERRFEVIESTDVLLIDDAYNASPLSFRAALESLKAFAGRRWFVVAGDMLELGGEADAYHEELGGWLAQAAPHTVLTVGKLAERAGQAAIRAGLSAKSCVACGSPEEAAELLRPLLQSGDVVLVKGSHAMGMDRCIENLKSRHLPLKCSA